MVFATAVVIYFYDFEKQKSFQPIKSLIILLFVAVSLHFFSTRVDFSHDGHSKWNDVPGATIRFGYIMGILAFSFT